MEDEEQLPNDSEEDNPDSQFEFFLEFTKPLVLELPSADDRAVAAAWVQRLETEPETREERTLRVDYLKLLSFVMQRGLLVGMFKKEPEPAPLPPFPNGFGLAEMGNALLEEADLQASGDTNESQLSYSIEISNDLKEFVAAQEVPNFGVQMYYAWSVEDPIHMWQSYDENKFPPHVREKVKQLKKITSDEKTDVQSYNIQLEKADFLVRKSYDPESSNKRKIKVKSPQEIERERSSQFEFDFSGSRRKSSARKNSPEGSSLRMDFANCLRNKSCCRVQEMGSTSPEGEEDNQVECQPTDEDDEHERSLGEFRSGTAGSCPQGIRGKSSKSGLQGRVASSSNDQQGLRNTDQFGLEMNVDWGGCTADPGEKYHMGTCDGFSPTSANRLKSRCFSPADTSCQKSVAQGNPNAAYDSGEKCTHQAPERSRICTRSNPCQSCKSMQEQLRESNSYPQKKEKSATDNSSSKPKQQDCGPPKMQENPCPAIEQAMKINRKKDHMDQLVGCTCGNNVRQKQIENLNRITQQKTSPCCADKPLHSGQKSAGTDKRQQQMPQQCGAPPQDENVCMKSRKGAEPAPGGGSAKKIDQVANSIPSQFQGSCRSKGDACYQNMKKTPKPEYEPQVKGLHVVGMTPCPAPKKTPCQVPPPAIFTRLVETPLNRCFTDDLSSASEDNCGEEDGQNGVPNMNPNNTRLKDPCANDFQCDDAPADEAAGCYSSSSENGAMNKAWNEDFDNYDNPHPIMCAKIAQMVKPNLEEPHKRYCEGAGQEVNAPPNSPELQGRFTEKFYRNRNQRCGLEQRSPGRSKCSGYDSFAEQSPGMKKFMTSTPYGGDPCPLEEVFPNISKISENDARCNTYQKENYRDEYLMQRQQFPEERSPQKSLASAGWEKLTDQKKLVAGTPTDECRSFMSLADCIEDGMTGANQRQELGFKDSKLTRSACQNRDEKNWLGPTQDHQKFVEMRGRRGTQGPGQEWGAGQLRSQYTGVPVECNMNDASQWTEITRRSQYNRNIKNSKQQSCPKELLKWEESQGQDDDNSEWVEWPDNMKRYHVDRYHGVQKRC